MTRTHLTKSAAFFTISTRRHHANYGIGLQFF